MQKKIYLFSFATVLWLALSSFYNGPTEAPSRILSGELSECYAPPPPCIGPNTDNGDFPAGQMTQWTVPAGVTEVEVIAIGGDGGSNGASGGRGAIAQSTLPVNPGDVLNIIVAGTAGPAGGGGGTGIYNATSGEVLIVAGGGGGGGWTNDPFYYGQGGQATEDGGNADGKAISGGTNGSGGAYAGGSGGGGGAFSAGEGDAQGGGGQGVPNGGNGGLFEGSPSGAFGFGGGGAAYYFGGNQYDAGGGGGYSGGGAAFGFSFHPGGGGGSFVHAAGTNTSISAGTDGSGTNDPGAVFLCYTAGPVCDISIDNITLTDESCPGANDGSLTVSASCTTCASIEYSVDGVNFQAGNTFSSLMPGPYTVTVRDTGDPSCEATDNATVNGGPTTDTDSDGTPDCSDGCPSDPGKIAPGLCGCGVAETDSDSDGTPDCIDECPNDPDKFEVGICGCGTPETDCIDACAAFNGVIDDVMNEPTNTMSNGQKNSLVTKLHHAKLNFEEGDNTVAINQLNAFINQVSAQSGNKIPASIAQEWIDIAQEIIDNINNGSALCIQSIVAAPTNQVDAYQPAELTELNESDDNSLMVFPNPFSDQVNLQIYLPESGKVNLSIFNLQGQRVATLLDKVLDTGFHQLDWNGGQLPAGVYLFQLQSENGVVHQKISKSK